MCMSLKGKGSEHMTKEEQEQLERALEVDVECAGEKWF
ncbi:hypothetical protein SAMN05216232_0208 [Virgibacillus subterraneus]|uniref:Uncharacterized protein n=1 Tax=Virgibacillus subterraneus TaxID=621109 RepID=A0A1H8YZ03_9BACI|nr:hypothetical protein SAMN05216232_0208 [Virgibacillus subterraneus]